jgi:hypothetical protein
MLSKVHLSTAIADGGRDDASGDVEEPGVARVVNIERGLKQSKRAVLFLSDSYAADQMADFENVMAQTMGIWDGRYRLLPVKIENIAEDKIRAGIRMLQMLDLTHPSRAERAFDRLVLALKSPLPQR